MYIHLTCKLLNEIHFVHALYKSMLFFQSKVTMSESLLEDMILSLDSNFDNYLDYKELAEGLNMWRKERRENRRKALSRESTNLSQKSETSNYKLYT